MNVDCAYFAKELLGRLGNEVHSGLISIIPDAVQFFLGIEKHYPIQGSKIQWSKVPCSIELSEPMDELQEKAFSNFFNRITTHYNLRGKAVYVGDGAIDFALLASVEEFSKHLSFLFLIPQHHYFIASDFSWCIVFTFEGDMAFGYRPPKAV